MNATPRTETLANIEKYVQKVEGTEYAASSRDTPAYEARLEKTISGLNARLEKERKALEELKNRTAGLDMLDPHTASPVQELHFLKVTKSAYTNSTPTEPVLPNSTSLVPSLLALRTTSATIPTLSDSITQTSTALTASRSRLARENSDLAAANAVTTALESRLTMLRTAGQTTPPSADDRAKERITALRSQTQAVDASTKALMRALIRFTQDLLARMLAAEELGGPVAGSLLEITDEQLAMGFNQQGKPRRTKKAPTDDARQQRIDKIWGQARDGEGDAQFDEGEERNEAQAAGQAMQELIEDLLNQRAEGAGWVEVEKENAAVRFLVRSGVAVLHRNDARKVRLVDFGRGADD